MTRLVVARHGETTHNTEGVVTGHIDVGLTERGVRQAEKLGERLAEEEDVEVIYSSDLERANRTADIVAEKTGAERMETEKLRERTFGVYDGESPEKRSAQVDTGEELDTWRPEEGENIEDVQERVMDVVEEVEEEYEGGTAVIVGHAWTNRAIITGILDSGTGHAHHILQDNTCVNVLEKWDDFRGWRLCRLNDTRHLG